ncbi:YfiT family bacillithiol transferase [Lihuaxuella thermophila]|uniref:Putative metal-dependent hydrolase SAMN05444955_11779 n=1 Tax=Lihuaxuella thermophila TaxID=1173111 RepID=A0A1H8IGM0_9BACL|nr:bacillithiol transferase BstA [Lihuaxuella thermophila]SEN67684.1 DinB superfamily protein [Lihuaxuella thermophila]
MEHLRYPIGQFQMDQEITGQMRLRWIDEIAAAPGELRQAVQGLTEDQLNTPYRPGGWTVRQVVHHLPDSHLNSYVRFKWALTEEVPFIKPYDEKEWAELADSRTAPIEVSLSLFDSLHQRWTLLLRAMTDEDFRRTFRHPESGTLTLDQALGLYAWHGKHHIAHITSLRKRMGW